MRPPLSPHPAALTPSTTTQKKSSGTTLRLWSPIRCTSVYKKLVYTPTCSRAHFLHLPLVNGVDQFHRF